MQTELEQQVNGLRESLHIQQTHRIETSQIKQIDELKDSNKIMSQEIKQGEAKV